jgi:hypothetical protein
LAHPPPSWKSDNIARVRHWRAYYT